MDTGVVEVEGSTCVIELDAGIYHHDAVMRAAHRLSGKCAPIVESQGERLVVRLRAPNDQVDSDALGREFLVIALDEVLRRSLREKTEALRAVIIAEAFSKTSILRPELADTDPGEDTLEIGQPDAASGRHHG